MICEKELRTELKRLPALRRRAVDRDDWDTACEIAKEMEFIQWVLNDVCECKEKR